MSWQPSASFELIKLRAQTLKKIRHFFDDQGVLEVDTPVLSYSTIPDPFIESFQTRYLPLTQIMQNDNYYLHTSPEFPMKRLLASGSGSIYQIAKVFRQGEISAYHNPEFTLLEWYREDWDHHRLMQEVNCLLRGLLSPLIDLTNTVFISYQRVFQEQLGINPHTVSKSELIACAKKQGLADVLNEQEDNDLFLELLFSHIIQPCLGSKDSAGQKSTANKPYLCFLYHYPASQASLAKISTENDCLVAERFEIFINGIELGNGFHELNNTQEQKARFEEDNYNRKVAGQAEIPLDERFLNSLNYLPQCAGVAVGIDRLLMVMSQAKHINEVIAFPFDRA
ncbi:MAG: elongation factor P--(R)-beta-lysine ligase [gamma proteobacterium symbiont of Taylorina sp.]|nr:elongation factor P--(R)-beta-lysine ligase [gamma proteobacterium symbiont of Taylorina sp.]